MIASPCIKICKIDPETKLCAGCYRTIEEIAAWASLSEAARARVQAALPVRRRIREVQP
jgi:predicted Fe-S protein YdhL (DUF1289 family)